MRWDARSAIMFKTLAGATFDDDELRALLQKWARRAKVPATDFRSSEQAKAVAQVLDGEDLLVVMPTGSGKSLIYQFPAWLESESLTLVISPLRALMNQHSEMWGAATINSETVDRAEIWNDVVAGSKFILLVSPARQASRRELEMK